MEENNIILFENIEFYKIRDFPNYAISKCGKVYSIKNNIILKKSQSNYEVVNLMQDKKKLYKTVHRLVAEQFISNPENKPTINHKDGDKFNNHVNNLEWNTYSENQLHAIKNNLAFPYFLKNPIMKGKKGKLHPESKKINQYDKQGNFIRTWDSLMDVQRELNIKQRNLSETLSGRNMSAGGFIWKYYQSKDL